MTGCDRACDYPREGKAVAEGAPGATPNGAGMADGGAASAAPFFVRVAGYRQCVLLLTGIRPFWAVGQVRHAPAATKLIVIVAPTC